MKRSGKLLILLLVLAVLGVGAYAAIKLGEQAEERERKAQEETAQETQALSELTASDIKQIAWKTGDTDIAFERTEDGWKNMADDAFPVNSSAVEKQAELIAGITTAKEIQNTADKSQFGFDTPEVTVTVNGDLEYVFGKPTNLTQGRYLLLGGRVFVVDYSLADSLKLKEADVMKYDEIPEMAYVLHYKAESKVNDFLVDLIYVMQDDEGNGTFYIRDDMSRVISQVQTSTLLNNIYTEKLRNCVNYNASEEDLEEYGLADPVMTVYMKFVNSAGETGEYTLYIGNPTDENEKYRYAKIPGSKMVYAYDNWMYTHILMKDYDYLEDKAQYD